MIEIIHCQQLSLYIYTVLKTAASMSNKALYMLLVELELDVIVPACFGAVGSCVGASVFRELFQILGV